MSLATEPLPANPSALRIFAADLQAELARKDIEIAANAAEIHAKTLHIEKLKMQLAVLRRARFGRSSEKLNRDIEQLELLIGALEQDAAAEDACAGTTEPDTKTDRKTPARTDPRKQPVRTPLPAHLPRETVTHEPACICAGCGGTTFSRIGQDEREVLEYVPSSFKVIRHVRPKLSCRSCETIVQAPMPSLPIERGRPGPGLIAHVLVSKYCDHAPLTASPSSMPAKASRSTVPRLADWVGKAEFLLAPLAEAIRPACLRRHRAACRRHHRPGARARPGEDQNRTALGRRARRTVLGLGGATGGILSLLGQSQGQPCGGTAWHLPRLSACRRVCRVRQALPAHHARRRSAVGRGRMLEPCTPKVL